MITVAQIQKQYKALQVHWLSWTAASELILHFIYVVWKKSSLVTSCIQLIAGILDSIPIKPLGLLILVVIIPSNPIPCSLPVQLPTGKNTTISVMPGMNGAFQFLCMNLLWTLAVTDCWTISAFADAGVRYCMKFWQQYVICSEEKICNFGKSTGRDTLSHVKKALAKMEPDFSKFMPNLNAKFLIEWKIILPNW